MSAPKYLVRTQESFFRRHQQWTTRKRRGDVMADLVSPNDIKNVLAETCVDDEAKTGFPGWRFMTITLVRIVYYLVIYQRFLIRIFVWCRGENPFRNWTITVSKEDKSANGIPSWDGTWFSGVLPLIRRSSGHQWLRRSTPFRCPTSPCTQWPRPDGNNSIFQTNRPSPSWLRFRHLSGW